jgi:hypothetical protein
LDVKVEPRGDRFIMHPISEDGEYDLSRLNLYSVRGGGFLVDKAGFDDIVYENLNRNRLIIG